MKLYTPTSTIAWLVSAGAIPATQSLAVRLKGADMGERKQSSTDDPILFFMADATNLVDGETGLSLTVTISKNGGAFASPTGAVSEISSGWYSLAGNASDRDTLGPLLVRATGAGAAPADVHVMIVAHKRSDIAGSGFVSGTHGLSETASLSAMATEVLTDTRAIKYAALISGDFSGEHTDEYTVKFLESGEPLTSGITSPTITVLQRSDDSTLVDAETLIAMSNGWYKFDESSNRVPSGDTAMIDVSATYGGATIKGQLMRVNYE